MFEPFEGVPDYPRLEQEILRFWDEFQIFNRLREQAQDGERWDFQDGPITANNPMGVHHAWGRTYKDIFDRFHAMRGRRLRWQNGFDCQGLWVEVEVEKALGFQGKPDIERFGLEDFSRECRARVEKFAGVISEQSKRLGMWMDWEKSYYTFDDSNIEHIWLFLKKCHDEGWLAQDYRVMPWCPRCETSLSQHESADSYQDITHRSVVVKLPVLGNPQLHGANNQGQQLHFAVWTTTPWTLTANTALAVNPNFDYDVTEDPDNGALLIWAEKKDPMVMKHGKMYRTIGRVRGEDLVGLTYSGPFDDIPFQQELTATVGRRVVAWDEVGETEGTGIVHIAPGCGAEDFELGKRCNLGFIVPVNTAAHFLPGAGPLAALHALDDVERIFEELRARDRIYRIQKYEHSYPHCWRCGTELIFYAVKEWFIRADAGPRPARERLRRAAREVEWIPDYAGKRMDDWLANMGDWCISRKRFWGLPLPFYMDDEGNWDVVGSRAELRERAVDSAKFDALPELHRPWIDDVVIWNRERTKTMRRVPEVGDAWLDAGIVPFSTVGYNCSPDIRMPELKIPSEAAWEPADFISEMREQVRLWFFSMLFMAVALEDRAPYLRAMVYETMLDQDGDKISKTKGNGVPFGYAVALAGADPLRWAFCGNPLTKDIRFGIDPRLWKNADALQPPDGPLGWDPGFKPWFDPKKPAYDPVHEAQRRLLTLWNVYSFFVTYANLDKPDLGALDFGDLGFSGEPSQNPKIPNPQNPLDKWILARLQQLIAIVTAALDAVEPSEVTRGVEAFVDDLSNWHVRRSRRRFWKSESDTDKQAAYQTLHHVLLTLCRLIAPAIPFTAETMYQNLKRPLAGAPQSVHLCLWPQVDESLRDAALVAEVEHVLTAVSLGHKARKESKVKVRQPLPRVLVQAPSAEARRALEAWRETILDELNVKALELLDDAGELVTYKLRANLPKLGPKFGKQIGAIRQALENAAPDEARRLGNAARRGENVTMRLGEQEIQLAPNEILVQAQQQTGYSFATEGDWAVAIDTTVDEDLLDEGYARDFVRAVQDARKRAGLQVSDHIAILVVEPGEGRRFSRVLEKFGDTIQDETLAEELRLVGADYPELSEAEVGEETVRLRVEKL